MSVHFHRALEKLKQRILALSAIVEQRVHQAVKAVEGRDPDLAEEVIRGDVQIDQAEVEVEEECLKILALYQPVAADLRFLVAVLKINNDLERIGDLAVNIARKAVAFSTLTDMDIPFDLAGMSEKTKAMLRDSLDALVNLDAGLAKRVCAHDQEINRRKHDISARIDDMIQTRPELAKPLLKLRAVSRNLERVADLTTNIAEDVIYMVEGKIVRHGADA
jgi:phosphate transport system protein